MKKDRVIVILGLAAITVLAWLYITKLALEMKVGTPHMQSWDLYDFLMMFIMWTVMMIAMMTPSATPMVLMFYKVHIKRKEENGVLLPTFMFLGAYLVVWTGFSLLATLAQWGLHSVALLSPMMVATSPLLGGMLILAAGIFQLTSLKHACLRHCRSPLGFILQEWRSGMKGTFLMGLKHGIYCVGCCWALMALLFVTGVMNLLWVAIIAGFVLIEKILPKSDWIGRITGLILIIWGMWSIIDIGL
ncbi:DUF2182 domain-containing protein [Aliifodinibius sp. S!AR15-10]|uniref:DUF2182 domain-containing protein n=1 Tax=Aliifodinibius sp. S!AR15-10 TaxID=2950437 RepID=UPI0028673795|nr:DUF2182 domain-containing protein [Aliifodinibius sp. S!AR15-10]MDR8389516.1 DUF2182 domain-containing protein [Aliifodinibius sp. S!AR15-10]